MIDGAIQKDAKSNLVPLCKQCHMKVHHDSLVIFGYKQTSSGVMLDFIDKTAVQTPNLSPVQIPNQSSVQMPVLSNTSSENTTSTTSIITSPLGSEIEIKTTKKRKYNDEQITIICEMAKTSKISKKIMCTTLESQHDIKISVTTLNKMIRGEY
tara:strand:+ start:24 stop:485 length:462 start_codon:yes stop_codon:yes gene_type:complete